MIYVGCYIGRSWTSKFIQKATRSQYSHVSFIRDDCSVIEAWEKGGVAERDHYGANHTPGTKIELYRTDMTEREQRQAWDFCRWHLGDKYDWRAIVSFATRSRTKHNPERWICSELVASACQYAGNPLQARVPSFMLPPCWVQRSTRLEYAGTVTTGEPLSSARLDQQWTYAPPERV